MPRRVKEICWCACVGVHKIPSNSWGFIWVSHFTMDAGLEEVCVCTFINSFELEKYQLEHDFCLFSAKDSRAYLNVYLFHTDRPYIARPQHGRRNSMIFSILVVFRRANRLSALTACRQPCLATIKRKNELIIHASHMCRQPLLQLACLEFFGNIS